MIDLQEILIFMCWLTVGFIGIAILAIIGLAVIILTINAVVDKWEDFIYDWQERIDNISDNIVSTILDIIFTGFFQLISVIVVILLIATVEVGCVYGILWILKFL